MKHEYGKLLENKTAATGKAVSTRTERITGLFCAPQIPGGLVSRFPGLLVPNSAHNPQATPEPYNS